MTRRVPLRHAAAPPVHLRLREPRGHDELALDGVDTRSAVTLLDSLAESSSDSGTATTGRLCASDRDALLAALHRLLWGDRIVSSIDCTACGTTFDLSFDLSALERRLSENVGPIRFDRPANVVDDAHAEPLYLPDAADEEAAARLGIEAGCRALLASVTRSENADAATVGERLERLAPLIDVDLEAACVECGHGEVARFDVQSFVLQRMLDERPSVLGDVHALASGYRWSLHEILSLPRSLRRSLVRRVGAATSPFG